MSLERVILGEFKGDDPLLPWSLANHERFQSKLEEDGNLSKAQMRHEAISGVQETLDVPGVVGMKADFSGGILDLCEGRAAGVWWIFNTTKAKENLHPSGENAAPQGTRGPHKQAVEAGSSFSPPFSQTISLGFLCYVYIYVYMTSTEAISRK